MTALPMTQSSTDCWHRIGVWGDRSCPELQKVFHCHNCPVFAGAGRQFLDAPSPEGYLAEWTDRLATPIVEAACDLQSLLIFRLAEEWLALSVQALIEVTTPRSIHRVPFRKGILAGIVNIRGELHLCVRIGQLLGLGEEAGSNLAGTRSEAGLGCPRFLVVKHENDGWVFPVDEVDRVHRFPTRELAATPVTVARAATRFTRGVFYWHNKSVGCLDEARLFEALRAKLR